MATGAAVIATVYFAILGLDNKQAPAGPPPTEVTYYVTRPVMVRGQPTTRSTALTSLGRGVQLNGTPVTGADGVTPWLQITSGVYAGNFVWRRNLSPTQRPQIIGLLDRDMVVRIPATMRSEPSDTADGVAFVETGSTVHVVGEVESGWAEILLRAGGVAYLPLSVF